MKTLKLIALTLLTTTTAFAGGSMGSTGGGNLPDGLGLLPARIEIYLLAKVRQFESTSRRRCRARVYDKEMNALPGSHYELRYEFDSSLWPRPEALTVSTHFIDNHGRSGFARARALTWKCMGEIERFEVAIDGRRASPEQLASRIGNARRWIQSHLNVADTASWVEAEEFDALFSVVRNSMAAFINPEETGGPYQMGWTAYGIRRGLRLLEGATQPIVATTLKEKLLFEIGHRSQSLLALALTTVSEDGVCDPQRYNELRARMRRELYLGSAHFFARLGRSPLAFCSPYEYENDDFEHQCVVHLPANLERDTREIQRPLMEVVTSSIIPLCDQSLGQVTGLAFDEPGAEN